MEEDGGIRFYKPCRALQPYVRYYWVLKSRESFSTLTFPIGCPQIIFHKRSPLFSPELSISQNKVTISGQVNFPAHVCSDGDTEMIVTVFQPHAIGLFIDTPPSLFYNLEISGYEVENRNLNELASRIFDCRDNGQCVRMIELWLLAKLRDISVSNFVRIGSAVRMLMKTPSTSVSELAGIACIGKKQFERLFNASVGMNPKEYARVVRLQKSLWQMQCGCDDDTGIAYVCGYADQSHFIRECKMFSGCTPGKLRNEYRLYSDLFTQPV